MAGGVKNFFWERSGAALLFSSLNDAASIAASEVSDADNVTRVPSQASDTILRDTMQIQPVIRINQGAEVGIMVARDFEFSNIRLEKRRVGKERVRTCRSRRSRVHSNKQNKINTIHERKHERQY